MKKTVFTFLLVLMAATGLMLIQNCNGTRVRSAELDVSLDEVDAQLAQFSTLQAAGVTTGSTFQQDLAVFNNLRNQPGATLYYAEAPGSMGTIQNVAPMTLVPFFQQTTDANGNPVAPPPPTYLQFYFVITDDGSSALIIAGSNSSAAATTTGFPTSTITSVPDPFASPTPATGGFHQILTAKNLKILDGTVPTVPGLSPTPVPGTNPPVTAAPSGPQPVVAPPINFIFTAVNDGQAGTPDVSLAQPLAPAQFSDGDAWIDLNYSNMLHLVLHTYDIVNGDLGDTIQFEVYQEVNGQDLYMGLLNLTEPQ